MSWQLSPKLCVRFSFLRKISKEEIGVRPSDVREGAGGPNFRIVLFWVRDEGEGPIAVKDRRLGTDRRRSRQRTVVVSDVSYATVYLVRNALAGIERATCSTERLAVRTASCGSRRERFAARRVGEHVSSDVSLCMSYQS